MTDSALAAGAWRLCLCQFSADGDFSVDHLPSLWQGGVSHGPVLGNETKKKMTLSRFSVPVGWRWLKGFWVNRSCHQGRDDLHRCFSSCLHLWDWCWMWGKGAGIVWKYRITIKGNKFAKPPTGGLSLSGEWGLDGAALHLTPRLFYWILVLAKCVLWALVSKSGALITH